MNHSGMAIASDTITTLGGSKTLGNASKIYEIGDGHKVLVLHNGAVNINRVSSQLHVTEWSSQLSKPLARLEDYVHSFIEWFDSPRAIYGKESAEALVADSVRDYFSWVAYEVQNKVKALSNSWEGSPEDLQPLIDKTVSETIASQIEVSKGWNQFENFSESAGQELIAKTPDLDVKEIIQSEFLGISLTPGLNKKLLNAATYGVNRISWMNSDAELVFVGFGDSEPFASTVRLSIRGAYGGKLRCNIAGRSSINATHPVANLYPFAQDDAIQGFVRGWTDKMRDTTAEVVFNSTWDALAQSGLTNDYELIDQISNSAREMAVSQLRETSLNTYAYPLMDTVAAMSLIGLADLSESLIGIQAAATFNKAGAATVGGFVEVATIDRQYGVRWIKKLGN